MNRYNGASTYGRGARRKEGMTDALSDDARIALAFIRDHPGQTFEEINRQIPIGTERLFFAMKQLTEHKQIERRNRPYRHVEQKGIPKAIVFYPA